MTAAAAPRQSGDDIRTGHLTHPRMRRPWNACDAACDDDGRASGVGSAAAAVGRRWTLMGDDRLRSQG